MAAEEAAGEALEETGNDIFVGWLRNGTAARAKRHNGQNSSYTRARRPPRGSIKRGHRVLTLCRGKNTGDDDLTTGGGFVVTRENNSDRRVHRVVCMGIPRVRYG